MATRTIDAAIEALAGDVAGQIISPGDGSYDEARNVYNGMHDRRPAVIVRCANTADVASAIRLASDHGLDLAVRGGGHSGPGFGTCDGGVVADLSGLKTITVDPGSRTVRAGGGCLWREFDAATHEHGLATTGGTLSSTGIAGLTLGGGFGYITRLAGLSCDNVLSMDVVTASGEAIVADPSNNEDLFWALRGGSGNFGIVTSFMYQLYPVSEVLAGPIVFPLEAAHDVLPVYVDLVKNAPDDFGGVAGLAPCPPFPFLDEGWHGKPVCLVLPCWTGDPKDLDDVIAPIRSASKSLGEGIGPMPYPVLNTLFDELLPPGLRHYWKGNFAKTLPDEAIAAHVENAAKTPTIESATFLMQLGGRAARIGADETAFGHRDAVLNVVIGGIWHDASDDEANRVWVRDYFDALKPYSEEGAYVNFMAADDTYRVPEGYGKNFARLQDVKKRYDPTNVFHINHNIAPS